MANNLRKTLKAWDPIDGAMGRCYANIDGNLEEMMYLKDVSADAKKNKKAIRVLGYSGTKHKSAGWEGTGKATIYYVTSYFRKLMLRYMNENKDFYFDMFVENEDPTSETGKQGIWLKNVNIDGITLAKLDINNTELDEEISFTFDGASMTEEFSTIVGE